MHNSKRLLVVKKEMWQARKCYLNEEWKYLLNLEGVIEGNFDWKT